MPAPIGNQHNKKPEHEVLNTRVWVRCNDLEKERWKGEAEKDGLSLSEFLRNKLNNC